MKDTCTSTWELKSRINFTLKWFGWRRSLAPSSGASPATTRASRLSPFRVGMEPPTSVLARLFRSTLNRGKPMELADLFYSGLMFAAGMLSLWTAFLLTATVITLAPTPRKSEPGAATISSTRCPADADRAFAVSAFANHGAKEATPARSVSETLPQRPNLGRPLRPAQ